LRWRHVATDPWSPGLEGQDAVAFAREANDGLARAVSHASFEPLLTRAERLDVPLYLHPGIPLEPVRKAYFEGLPPPASFLLGSPGWGWHAETAVHVLRLVLSGTLDRHPRLRLIIGHMGEMLPAAASSRRHPSWRRS